MRKRLHCCRRFVAERAGFEPASPCGEHALQACALGQTTQPLRAEIGRTLILRARLYHSPLASLRILDGVSRIRIERRPNRAGNQPGSIEAQSRVGGEQPSQPGGIPVVQQVS